MSYNQTNTTEISLKSAFGDLLRQTLELAADKDRRQDQEKSQPIQKPERTSEEKRLEYLGYFF